MKMKKILWRGLSIAAVLYLCAIGLLFAAQRSFLYPVPSAARTTPEAAQFPQAEEVVLDTSDGEKVIVWHVAPQPGKPVVLFFHGNGEMLAWDVWRFREFVADGTGLIALSFRGYGGSSGHPSESGLLKDGLAATAFALRHYKAERLVLWGYSLGTGVAVALGAQFHVNALILEAPFTSVAEVAAGMFPFVPARLLILDKFHSDQRIAAITSPLLIMHGEKDSVIPIELGRLLYEMAPQPKRFVAFPEGTHVTLPHLGTIALGMAFVRDINLAAAQKEPAPAPTVN